jgi:LEA14-like dessication related protein
LVLDVTNPNTYDLRTGQVDLALDIADARFGEASLGRATTFEAGGVTTIEIPLSFTWAGVGAGARSLLEQGSVRYSLETRLTVGTPLGDRPVEMTTRGTVPVQKLIRQDALKPGASRDGASISSG